ncbi:hydrolase, partial [Enterovibrio nigricans]
MVDSGNTYRDKVSQLISWGHWFSFFNIIAAMLLGTRYIAQSGWPETLLGQTYQLLTWLGHFGFLVFAVYILIIFPASFVIPSQRLMRLFAVFVATAGMTLLLLDIYAYETLHLHLNPLVWELLLSGEKTDMNAHWQYLFVVVPAIFLLELIMSEWVWRKLRKLSRKRVGVPIATVFAVCFIGSHLIHIWADAFLYSPVTSQRSNFPISYPMTAKTFMEKYGLLDRQEYQRRRDEIGNQESEVIRYPLEKLSFSSKASSYNPNLLIVMVESLRSDMLDPVVMPNLDDFASHNVKFMHHYSSSNDSMAGLFGLF